jgi:crossover junction endodeoxyribonuclease RusA
MDRPSAPTPQEPAGAARATAGITLVLPLPPSINSQYVTVGRRRVLSAGAQRFKREVVKRIDRARLDGAIAPETERALRESLVGAYLIFYFATPMRRDLDGGLKIALDAVCEPLRIDDRSVVDLHLTKQIDPLRPRLEIELEAIADWTFDRSYVYLGEADESQAPEPAGPRTIPRNVAEASPSAALEEPAE